MHAADRAANAGTAVVGKELARPKQGLLAYHPQAADILSAATGILDDPVPRHELRSDLAHITDGDKVGETENTLPRIGISRQILGFDSDIELRRGPHGIRTSP